MKQKNTTRAFDRDWWRNAVIYQIYPRSYCDKNNDGIGDLVGITDKLSYVAALGVDVIWISPFFPSPMKDFGYDVRDYCDVDPIFGTIEDFKNLLCEAHRLNIKVIIDLVLSHSSDQHPWFIESRQSRKSPRADWYVWSDPKSDGTPPNNWLSLFGGPAWQWDSKRRQYYFHNFLKEQPDLNFHTPAVQDALLDVVRFWLDLGVDGFRLDTINFYVHDADLRNNPALSIDKQNASISPDVNPYNYQDQIYARNRPENLVFLRRLRALLDRYDAIALGEVGDSQRGLEIIGEYTGGNDLIHMCYSFELLARQGQHTPYPAALDFAAVLARTQKSVPNGWVCWAYSNHDVMRYISRWQLSEQAVRLFVVALMCLPGAVCLYQGEELGLTEADIDFDDIQDPYGRSFWPEFKGRDGCRTPMVWDNAAQHSGFSNTADKLWLPIPPEHISKAVSVQNTMPNSLLMHYRKAIILRHAHAALGQGSLQHLQADQSVLSFCRVTKSETLFCAFNISSELALLRLPPGAWERIGDDVDSADLTPVNSKVEPPIDAKKIGTEEDTGFAIHLLPWQVCLARRVDHT